jgi:hypothetical protein
MYQAPSEFGVYESKHKYNTQLDPLTGGSVRDASPPKTAAAGAR